MRKARDNYAFIDSQNLYLGIRAAGWRLDFARFRTYLAEKYGVERAYLFFGYVERQRWLYEKLQSFGYELIFKPVTYDAAGSIKGNCDAELVLQAMIDFPYYDKTVLVSGDGDFACLANYLREQGKLLRVLIPNQQRYSSLLNLAAGDYLSPLDTVRHRLEMKRPRKGTEPQ